MDKGTLWPLDGERCKRSKPLTTYIRHRRAGRQTRSTSGSSLQQRTRWRFRTSLRLARGGTYRHRAAAAADSAPLGALSGMDLSALPWSSLSRTAQAGGQLWGKTLNWCTLALRKVLLGIALMVHGTGMEEVAGRWNHRQGSQTALIERSGKTSGFCGHLMGWNWLRRAALSVTLGLSGMLSAGGAPLLKRGW